MVFLHTNIPEPNYIEVVSIGDTIVNYGFYNKDRIITDEFTIGIWTIKYKKC